jgi:hypothetical protein
MPFSRPIEVGRSTGSFMFASANSSSSSGLSRSAKKVSDTLADAATETAPESFCDPPGANPPVTRKTVNRTINDRAGKYWKTLVAADSVAVSEDKKAGFKLVSVSLVLIDKRTDHATVLEGASARHKLVFGLDLDPADFTLGGFQKYCK